ncbi:MAG: hypothetical protein RL173_2741 [Fibrobacterota bacterium]|jgi:hypothetical protein
MSCVTPLSIIRYRRPLASLKRIDRHHLIVMWRGAATICRTAALLFVSVSLSGCDTVAYHLGPPPMDARLVVSEVEAVQTFDSLGLSTTVSWVASWEIDSVEFLQRAYRVGVAFGKTSPGWKHGPRSIVIHERHGSLRDTLRCDSMDCTWMIPRVLVLAEIDPGHFLSVAESSISQPKLVYR